MSIDVSPLFQPLTINGHTLRNRFVMPAMQRGWGDEGQVTSKTISYYRDRAVGGTGLIISESLGIDHPAADLSIGEMHFNQTTSEGWKRVADEIHSGDSKFLVQLWHPGAVRAEGQGRRPDVPPISPSGLFAGKPRGVAASAEDLIALKAAYAAAAAEAMAIGADGVEIHMAHGYLLHQFLWSESNLRDDGYGGDAIADRVRFPAEIVAAVRAAVGPSAIVSCRLSQWAEWDYDARVARTPDELRELIHTLEHAGIDVFNISTRYLQRPAWEGSPLPLAGWVKSMTEKPVVANGSVGLSVDSHSSLYGKQVERPTLPQSITDAVARFERAEFDLLAVGRSIIGDPDFVNKVRAVRLDEVRPFTRADLTDLLAHQSHDDVPDEIRATASLTD